MRRVLGLSLALASGCGAQIALPGTWALSKDGATAAYAFKSDSQFTFDGCGAGGCIHMSGAWFVNGAMLTLSFDGAGTYDAPYAIVGDTLTITDDPATVRAGSHASAIYTRQ